MCIFYASGQMKQFAYNGFISIHWFSKKFRTILEMKLICCLGIDHCDQNGEIRELDLNP